MSAVNSDTSISRPHLPIDMHEIFEDESRSNQVLNEMHRFYKDERWVDVVLKVEESSFPSHRLVLAASSLYFEKMFTNGMCEERATEITLNDITSCALKRLLEFSYTSKLDVHSNTVLEVFEAADMLQFPSARRFCEAFLQNQIQECNCLSFMVYADAFSSELLYSKAKYCAASTFKKQVGTVDFFQLPLCHVMNLLKEDSIEMEYEEHVYEAMKSWILHDTAARKQFVPELFRCVRLNYVSRWFLIEKISKDSLLAEFSVAQQYIGSAKDQLLAQGHTYEIPWQLPPSRIRTGLTTKIVYISTHDPHPTESEVHLFDVVNKSWSNTNKACPLASEFSSCENVNETLLVIGGWSNPALGKSLNERGAVNAIHEFRVMSIFPTLWYVCEHKMGISRYLHSSVVVNNAVYLIGGYDESHCLQATMFVTDSERGYRFEVCPRLMYPVSRPAVAACGDRIYVFGGYGEGGVPRQFIQCYDINTRQWCEVKPGSQSLSLMCPTACQYATFINDQFYIVCGEVTRPQGCMSRMVGHLVPERVVDSIYTFNHHTKQWSLVFTFPGLRTGGMCFATLENKIYITGGEKNGLPYYCVDCFNPVTNTLQTVGNTHEGSLTLSTTLKVMHENFGL